MRGSDPTRARGGWRGVVALALALFFLTGTGGEVFGLHDCPVHHRDPGRRTPGTPGQHGDRPTPKDGPLRPISQGLCSCIGTCHGGAATPAWSPDQGAPAVPSAGPSVLRLAEPTADAPVRNPTFLLPYSTGPPATPVSIPA